MIFALGAQDRLVGTDLSSTYPEAAKKLTKVGYHCLLSAEGIISLKGMKARIVQLEDLDYPIVTL